MLSFHIQSNESEAKTNKCATIQILKEHAHFHMATSMLRTSFVFLLFRVHGGICLFVTHLQLMMPSLRLNLTSVYVLFSVRGFLAECILHSLLLLLHSEKPLMYIDVPLRIKLKACNYSSQQSGDSDPITAEDKHVNQTMQEATANLWYAQ